MEDFQLETVITLLTPYAAYIPAEHLGVSGVLATVAAGGYLGWRNPQLLSALTRFRGQGVWSVLLLLFNGLVFILIGLQLASIRALTTGIAWPSLIALLGGGQRRRDRGPADLRADRDVPAAPLEPEDS